MQVNRSRCGGRRGLEHERVAHVTQLDLLAVLTDEHVGTLEVPMRHVLTVEVVERLQRLLCVHSGVLLANPPILLAHLRDALVYVFQIDAQHVVLDDF